MKTLFSRLFGKAPPPPPPTSQQRIAALQTAPAENLVNTALGGDDTSMRIGAIQLLPDGEALRALAGLADPPANTTGRTPSAVRHAAHERLAHLVDEGSVDFASLFSTANRLPHSLSIAALCKDPDRLRQALASIEDAAEIAKLVVDGPSSRVRQAAASMIDDPAQWQALLPRVRDKDKAVYKLLKGKHDALVAEQRKAEEFARDAAALCASIEQHASKPHDARYAAALQSLAARWQALAKRPDPELEQRAEQALERCREVIAVHERELAAKAAALAAEQAAREERERVLEAERQAAAERAAVEAEAQVVDAIEPVHEVAEAVVECDSAPDHEHHDRTESHGPEAQAHRDVGSLIRMSSAALRRGDTRKAARHRQAIEEALPTTSALPPYLARTLQQLDERLNELRQWKSYVVAPKRIELIEEMEALIGSQEEPAELAEHIRALRQEWRTINKGLASDATEDAERFEKAYAAAYEPCKKWLAEQAAARRENLEARKQVLTRLQAFVAGQDEQNFDHRLVLQVLREAPQEWRSHGPVDREANRPVEREFFHSLDQLRGRLNAWYERNAADKRALINQAQLLSTLEDTNAAIEGVRRLQTQWKETGPVAHQQSQALWDEFRGLCDAVYQRREQAYAQYSATLESAKAQAIALCEQVEQACSETAAERTLAHGKIREWHAAFDEIGELPRSEARNLRNRFERAISTYEAGLAQQDLRDAEDAESNLFEAARLIRAYERAVTQDATAEDRAALRAAVEDFMEGVRRWPKGGLQALKQAVVRADSAVAGNDQSRENALRMLCIRGEILASLPTPTEDEDRRHEYQMRLLMENMGQGVHRDEQDWDALRLEWIAAGAAAPEVHETLEARFRRCLAQRARAHTAR